MLALLAFGLGLGLQPLTQTEPAPVPGKSVVSRPRPGKATALRRQKLIAEVGGFDLATGPADSLLAGRTRGNPYPVPVAPRIGRLYGLTPTFSWVYRNDVRSFTWLLFDAAEEELARRDVPGTTLQFPPDAPALEPGRTYYWAVAVPATLGKPRRSAPMGLKVLEPGLRETVAEALARVGPGGTLDRDFARARVLVDLKLWYDATSALDALVSRYPREARLYELRGALYAQLAWTQPLAERDFAQADQLLAASGVL